MSFAKSLMRRRERAPAKAKQRGGIRSRLDLVYFALAAFDILTICAALALNHVASTAFERSVRLSQDLSSHLEGLLALQHAAQLADAPGNDVFISHDVQEERRRLALGLHEFNARWDEMMSKETREGDNTENQRLMEVLRTTRPLMDAMMQDTSVILDQIERGNVVQAGRHMASLDQLYAQLNQEIESAISHAEKIQVRGFEEQVKLARQARELEWGIAGAIMLSVIMVAFYGLNIGRTMRRTDEAKERALEQLEAAHQRLTRYADNVSHELRGPVSKMRVNLDVLLVQDREAEDYREGIVSSLEECERLSNIIDGLLFLARAENTSTTTNLRSISLRSELALITDFFSASAEQVGVTLDVQTPDLRADVDRALFQRAVVNLVSNALSHTARGGRIVLRGRETADSTEIEVEDNGTGIAADELDSVFDRFHSTSVAPKADGAGLGLGLPITKAILDLHGGSIALRSEFGKGTCVTLTFPRRALSRQPSVSEPAKITVL